METAQAALERDPDNQEANKILGTIYAALVGAATADSSRATIRPTIPARAIAALEKARRDGAFDINLDLMLGRLYAQTGAFDKALPLLRHVVDDQPGYQEGALLLAAAQESAGTADDAIETLRRDAARQSGVLPRSASAGRDLRAGGDVGRGGADAFGARRRPSIRGTRRSSPRRALALINAGKAGEARGILQNRS